MKKKWWWGGGVVGSEERWEGRKGGERGRVEKGTCERGGVGGVKEEGGRDG